jgi:hypothetical protein
MISAQPERTSGRQRQSAVVTAALFLVSSVFPIVAGLTPHTSRFPRWVGVADVSVAFVLAIMAMIVLTAGQERVTPAIEATTYRTYRVLLHGILGLCLVFFVAGDHIVWIQCLTGFAWRAWLLAYCLPSWIACIHDEAEFR